MSYLYMLIHGVYATSALEFLISFCQKRDGGRKWIIQSHFFK